MNFKLVDDQTFIVLQETLSVNYCFLCHFYRVDPFHAIPARGFHSERLIVFNVKTIINRVGKIKFERYDVEQLWKVVEAAFGKPRGEL